MPEHLTFSDVSDRAYRLWSMLDRCAGAEASSMPSRQQLANALRCSVNSVKRAIAELVAGGWLEVFASPGGCNEYVLDDRPGAATRLMGGPTPAHGWPDPGSWVARPRLMGGPTSSR